METSQITLAPARIQQFGPVLIAGLSERYTDSTSTGIPAQWERFTPYIGHISTIRQTWDAIWNRKRELGIADAPSFERYTESFSPATGNGGIEIWTPLED